MGLKLAFMVVGTIVRAPHKPARFGLTVRNCRRSWDYRVPQDRRLTCIPVKQYVLYTYVRMNSPKEAQTELGSEGQTCMARRDRRCITRRCSARPASCCFVTPISICCCLHNLRIVLKDTH